MVDATRIGWPRRLVFVVGVDAARRHVSSALKPTAAGDAELTDATGITPSCPIHVIELTSEEFAHRLNAEDRNSHIDAVVFAFEDAASLDVADSAALTALRTAVPPLSPAIAMLIDMGTGAGEIAARFAAHSITYLAVHEMDLALTLLRLRLTQFPPAPAAEVAEVPGGQHGDSPAHSTVEWTGTSTVSALEDPLAAIHRILEKRQRRLGSGQRSQPRGVSAAPQQTAMAAVASSLLASSAPVSPSASPSSLAHRRHRPGATQASVGASALVESDDDGVGAIAALQLPTEQPHSTDGPDGRSSGVVGLGDVDVSASSGGAVGDYAQHLHGYAATSEGDASDGPTLGDAHASAASNAVLADRSHLVVRPLSPASSSRGTPEVQPSPPLSPLRLAEAPQSPASASSGLRGRGGVRDGDAAAVAAAWRAAVLGHPSPELQVSRQGRYLRNAAISLQNAHSPQRVASDMRSAGGATIAVRRRRSSSSGGGVRGSSRRRPAQHAAAASSVSDTGSDAHAGIVVEVHHNGAYIGSIPIHNGRDFSPHDSAASFAAQHGLASSAVHALERLLRERLEAGARIVDGVPAAAQSAPGVSQLQGVPSRLDSGQYEAQAVQVAGPSNQSSTRGVASAAAVPAYVRLSRPSPDAQRFRARNRHEGSSSDAVSPTGLDADSANPSLSGDHNTSPSPTRGGSDGAHYLHSETASPHAHKDGPQSAHATTGSATATVGVPPPPALGAAVTSTNAASTAATGAAATRQLPRRAPKQSIAVTAPLVPQTDARPVEVPDAVAVASLGTGEPRPMVASSPSESQSGRVEDVAAALEDVVQSNATEYEGADDASELHGATPRSARDAVLVDAPLPALTAAAAVDARDDSNGITHHQPWGSIAPPSATIFSHSRALGSRAFPFASSSLELASSSRVARPPAPFASRMAVAVGAGTGSHRLPPRRSVGDMPWVHAGEEDSVWAHTLRAAAAAAATSNTAAGSTSQHRAQPHGHARTFSASHGGAGSAPSSASSSSSASPSKNYSPQVLVSPARNTAPEAASRGWVAHDRAGIQNQAPWQDEKEPPVRRPLQSSGQQSMPATTSTAVPGTPFDAPVAYHEDDSDGSDGMDGDGDDSAAEYKDTDRLPTVHAGWSNPFGHEAPRRILFNLEIDIGGDRGVQLMPIREGDAPVDVAEEFAVAHGLPWAAVPRIASLVRDGTAHVLGQM